MTPERASATDGVVGRVAPTRRNGDVSCGGLGQTALPGSGGGLGQTALPGSGGGLGQTALPGSGGGLGQTALPERKRMDHRGPLSIDVTGAWYFITICAEGHLPWQVDAEKLNGDGRAWCPNAPLSVIAPLILREARENHHRGIWKLALMLVMPDHVHFIVHVCSNAGVGGLGQTALPNVVAQFKRLLSRRYGLRFQRDFWDTRLRDDAHYAEKFRYVCNNPVRKGLCTTAREWPHVIAFDRISGEERPHRNNVNEKGTQP